MWEVELFDKLELNPYFDNAEEHCSVSVTVGEVFSYTDASERAVVIEKGAQSQYFLFGTHGTPNTNASLKNIDPNAMLIFATKERKAYSFARYLTNKSYVIVSKNKFLELDLPLE